MIKLKKSKSKYSQYYKQYQRKISALRKQNIELRGANVYQTESQLRKWGIKGRDLAKITRQLKTDIKNLAKHEAYLASPHIEHHITYAYLCVHRKAFEKMQ